MTATLEIKRNPTLAEIEALERLTTGHAGAIHIKMAGDLSKRFFVESRVSALIGGLARHNTVVLTDWGNTRATPEWRTRFSGSPEGVASCLYTKRISSDGRGATQFDGASVVKAIIDQGGFGEAQADAVSRGAPTSSLTVYAFDDLDPNPLVLSNTDHFSRFQEKFERLRRKYLEVGVGTGYSERISPEANNQLSRFVYEIFQNTYRHGRLNEDNGVIVPNLRYLRIRRHICNKKAEFIERAAGFAELESFIDRTVKTKKAAIFYEVTLSDHGIGIPARFFATRPKYVPAPTSPEIRCHLVNDIIEKSLSSSAALAGAGNGLRNAIRDVDSLQGFLSIRTEDIWLCRSSDPEARSLNEDSELKKALTAVAGSTTLAPSCGTQVNMLFPMAIA